MNALNKFCNWLFCAAGVTLICVFCATVIMRHIESVRLSEIETRVDSVIRVRDSIKMSINHIDSIKNAKIIEVKGLDNDSTVRYFYKSIGRTRQ